MKESRQNRATNLRAKAEKANAEAIRIGSQAHDMASAIPLGQPILVDHYSAKGDMAYRAKIDSKYRRANELSSKAAYYEDRAQAAESNTAIYADDDDPVAAIDAKISTLEKERDAYKAGDHDTCHLANLNANIRRLKKRRESLSAMKSQPRREYEEFGVKVIEDPELARIQLVFDGKPSDLIRDTLKKWGFRWAPSQGAWQRNFNANGKYAARCAIKEVGGLQ